MAWDSDMNNDLWGSLLDDLPAELSNSDSDSNDQQHIDVLDWTNDIFKTSTSLDNTLSHKCGITEDKLDGKLTYCMNLV